MAEQHVPDEWQIDTPTEDLLVEIEWSAMVAAGQQD